MDVEQGSKDLMKKKYWGSNFSYENCTGEYCFHAVRISYDTGI